MIKIANQLVGMVLVGAIAGGVAFAKEIKREVTFSQPVVVNGTLIEKKVPTTSCSTIRPMNSRSSKIGKL